MDRRGFLKGILAAGVAPAFIGSAILMPVRKLWTPPTEIITGVDPAGHGDYSAWVTMQWDGHNHDSLRIVDWGPKDKGTFKVNGAYISYEQLYA